MSKYISKHVEIEATQWFKDGDHPAVYIYFPSVTIRFVRSDLYGIMKVEPGDWIITESNGSGHYSCADSVFKETYELVEE